MNIETQETTREEQHVAPVEAWDAIAAGYDMFVTPGEAGLATEALKLVGLAGGDRFLDVAAGTGGLSLPAARLGAKVIATDWSPKMIERFNARVREEHLPDVEGRVMDCHALAFADESFDITGSLFGVMLVPDQPKALREMVRVTKRGGRVLLIAYGPPSAFEALHVFIEALRAVNPGFEGLPSNPPPLEFQVSDPDVMRRRLTAAGLRNVTVDTTRQERIEVRSGQQLWDWCLGGNPIPGMVVADLTEEQKSAMRERIDGVIRARSNGGGSAVLTAPLNIGIGTK
jgi:ubiquinone/menaquinone biosynthesis C-methylase UbiE